MQRGVSVYRPCTICQDNCMLVEVATVTNLGAQEIGCQLALLGTYLKSGVFICYVKKKSTLARSSQELAMHTLPTDVLL